MARASGARVPPHLYYPCYGTGQEGGVFELNPPFDFVLVVSFSCFGFYYMQEGSTSVFFMQQIVQQSTVWQGSCIILKQSEYCGKTILRKRKRVILFIDSTRMDSMPLTGLLLHIGK